MLKLLLLSILVTIGSYAERMSSRIMNEGSGELTPIVAVMIIAIVVYAIVQVKKEDKEKEAKMREDEKQEREKYGGFINPLNP